MYLKLNSSSAGSIPGSGRSRGEGKGNPLQYSCLEKSHGRRNLVGCSLWGREELDTTERLHFHFSLSCIGEGNGNPLQCSCLENSRDGGAWWAAVHGVAQSWTWLKWLSSSSSSSPLLDMCFACIFPLCNLPVHPLDKVLCRAKVLKFDAIHFIHFSFYASCFSVPVKELSV